MFDVVLLSVGQDGSVASLHPNRKETAATDAWCLPVSRADLPPSITLSMPAVNRCVAIVPRRVPLPLVPAI